MPELVVRDKIINKDIFEILGDIQRTCDNGKLSQFKVSGTGIAVTCPHHNDGLEKRPSCFINIQNDKVLYGMTHCFTCGFKGSFSKFVGECFNRSETWGENWLLSNYSNDVAAFNDFSNLKKINLIKDEEVFLDESILDSYESYHPYMSQRGISNEIIKRFGLKYNPKNKTIIFPVRDRYGRLKFLTERSVEGKYFHIQGKADKRNIFCLNEVIKGNYKECVVCESQINALNAWSWGYPAIALLGAGTTDEQIEELNNTSIMRYILCYDGDDAGRKGANRFKRLIKKSVFVDEIIYPEGKDLADMGKEFFEVSLQKLNNSLL